MRSNKVNVFKKMLGVIMVAPVILSLSLFAADPVHHWELDETNGSTYFDSPSGDANGTCAFPDGCPTPSDGQVFGAQRFDGVDNVIEVNGTAFDWASDANITIEFWMKSDNVPAGIYNDGMIGRSNADVNDLLWYIGIDGEGIEEEGHIRASVIDGEVKTGKKKVNDGKWNHIAFVLKPGMVKVYVNGEYDFNLTRTNATDLSCDTNVTIGTLDDFIPGTNSDWSYTGQLDDIKLYNTDLNGSTIKEHYENGFAPHLKEVAPVDPTPTTNTEPAYTFASDEAGDISYQGCTSDANLTAVEGNNTIIFGPLEVGIYDDCNITVTDADGNASDPLLVSEFVVDTTAPVITLTGAATINLLLGDTYIEQGATCTDNYDAVCNVTIGGDTVDTSTVGNYTVTYDATDASGNAATQVTRTVIVEPVVSSSGGGCSYNPNSNNFDMTFLLMMALGLLYPFRRRFLK